MERFMAYTLGFIVGSCIVFGTLFGVQALQQKNCYDLGVAIDRQTVLRNNTICYVEIAPNLFVRQDEVIYNLNNIKPLEKEK